jgi:hypothetical protein
MYKEYLEVVRPIYQKIETEYAKYVNVIGSKKMMHYMISKKLGIPIMDIAAAIVVIEQNYNDSFRSVSEILFDKVPDLIDAKTQDDKELVRVINEELRKTLNISKNTLAKYVKICIFTDLISEETEGDVIDDKDKLEEPMGEADADKEEDACSPEPTCTQTCNLELLRKELVAEMINSASQSEDGFIVTMIKGIKNFFSGK